MDEQLFDPLVGELEEVETVASEGLALAVVVPHHLERALARCHAVSPSARAVVAGWRLVGDIPKTCCDILQASVRLRMRPHHVAVRNDNKTALRAPATGGVLP
ncbi:hypothetical protein ACVWZ6_006261 [Bradyrhizobium sp. GM6.1]